VSDEAAAKGSREVIAAMPNIRLAERIAKKRAIQAHCTQYGEMILNDGTVTKPVSPVVDPRRAQMSVEESRGEIQAMRRVTLAERRAHAQAVAQHSLQFNEHLELDGTVRPAAASAAQSGNASDEALLEAKIRAMPENSASAIKARNQEIRKYNERFGAEFGRFTSEEQQLPQDEEWEARQRAVEADALKRKIWAMPSLTAANRASKETHIKAYNAKYGAEFGSFRSEQEQAEFDAAAKASRNTIEAMPENSTAAMKAKRQAISVHYKQFNEHI
jgi:hypothetical protein